MTAGGHLVEYEAQREHVGTRVERLAAQLLRRHVSERPHSAGRVGERIVSGVGNRLERGHLFGQSEIENLYLTAFGEKHIGGFEVPVNQAAGMCRIQRVGKRNRVVEKHGQVQWAARETSVHRLALQQFHDEELTVTVLPDVVDGTDVRVSEGGNRSRFTIESGGGQTINLRPHREHLDCHVAVQSCVSPSIDLPHAAGADERDDFVGTEASAGDERHSFAESGEEEPAL